MLRILILTLALLLSVPHVHGQQPPGRVYALAGTETPLANGASFTGPWVDVQEYNSIVVAVDSDQPFAFNLEFSADGTTVRSSLARSFNPARIVPPERFTIGRQYARVIATNDSGVDMTDLSIQVLVGDKTVLNFPADSRLPQRAGANPVRIDNYKIDVGAGRREGATNWRKWGYNTDVDTASPETVWAAGGLLVPLTTARTLELVSSSSAQDAPAGTGMRQALIVGVGAGRVYQTETVALNGLGTITTTLTWLGVNRISPVEVGSTQANVGDITVTATTDGTTQAYIPAGTGITQQAFFFVPADRVFLADGLLINVLRVSGGGSPRASIFAYYHDTSVGSVSQVFRQDIDTGVESTPSMILPPNPFAVGGGDIIEFRASTDTNNTVVNINFWATELQDP